MKQMRLFAGMLTMAALMFGFSSCSDCVECSVNDLDGNAVADSGFEGGEECGNDDDLTAYEDDCEAAVADNADWDCVCNDVE